MDAATLGFINPYRVGRWWFQRRGVLIIPVLLLMVLAPPTAPLSTAFKWLAAVGLILGEGIRIWAVGFAGSVTRTRGDTVPELVVAGPFRHVRNPLYIGNLMLYTSAALFCEVGALALVVLGYGIVQYNFIIAYEEETLAQTFGARYDEYCHMVPRWLPRLDTLSVTTGQSFELLKALRSERATLLQMLLFAGLLYVKFNFLYSAS